MVLGRQTDNSNR